MEHRGYQVQQVQQTPKFREVWQHNLEEEMAAIRDAIEKFPYIAMDTEFPGVIARPVGSFSNQNDLTYQSLRCNVDLLKIIQLGITLFDEQGNMTPCTWQFNFCFNLHEDSYNQKSVELLKRAGLEFTAHSERGIDALEFGSLFMSSGLILNDAIKWISFHSYYDFAYLLKIIMREPLPAEESVFYEYLHAFFPCLYDIKYLIKSCKNLKGGLNDVAESLGVDRVGSQHQAGSDSLVTGVAFFKLRNLYFDGVIDANKYQGILYGLNVPYQNAISSSSSQPHEEDH